MEKSLLQRLIHEGASSFPTLEQVLTCLKTTLLGFASVIGTVVLDKTVKSPNVINLEMPLGV